MLIALFPNAQKKHAFDLATGVREYLLSRGVQLVVEDSQAAAFHATPLSSIDPKDIDFAISMGGDGTILRLLHRHPEMNAPIIGINLGHLGFMSEIPIADVYPSLHDLLSGNYRVENRIAMEAIVPNGDPFFAVNDIVVHRARNPSLVDLAIHVGDTYLNTFSADGIILSTPSGSTAYSLAAGGPILVPELDALVLTPISPHTISNRPIVLASNQEIQIQYLSEYDPVEITYDGISQFTLRTGEVLRIRRSPRIFRLVSLLRRDYFSTLRTKLGWTGKLRE